MRRRFEFSREELIALVREVAGEVEEGDKLTLRAFRRATGVPQSVVDRLFGSWNELKAAAELPGRRTCVGYSDEEMLAALHGVVERLWRMPLEREFDRLAGMCWATVRNRFGTMEEVVGAYRGWLGEGFRVDGLGFSDGGARGEGAGEERGAGGGMAQGVQPLGFGGDCAGGGVGTRGVVRNRQQRMPDRERDCWWVREQWEGLRVFFAGRSSEFEAERGAEIDLVVCWEDDAPECGKPVVELRKRWAWMGEW